MTRSFWTRLVLGLAVLTAPAILVGCAEETKPAATGTSTPPPGTDAAAKGGAPGAPTK
jgi:hypothetical protein